MSLCIVSFAVYAKNDAQVWFSSGDDLNVAGQVAHPDFMQLFASDAPWATGMANVDVMQMRAPWFVRMPDPAVHQVIDFLRGRRMALAVPMAFVTSETCGQGVEGIGDARGLAVYPREMNKKGIPLDYVVMDEPLYFGHDYQGKNACRFSIDQVTDSVAANVRMIRTFYPKVRFVLVEPEQSLPGGVAELSRFLDLYALKLHELPEAVRFDIAWARSEPRRSEWHHNIPPFLHMLKARGIGYSIIYNADAFHGHMPEGDAGWIASAEANVQDWETTVRESPAQVVIQTWNPNPVRIVPESDPTTMTGYLKWYLNGH